MSGEIERIKRQDALIESLREEARTWKEAFIRSRDESEGNTWIFMDDGDDHPESLTCPVVISADHFREFVSLRERYKNENDDI